MHKRSIIFMRQAISLHHSTYNNAFVGTALIGNAFVRVLEWRCRRQYVHQRCAIECRVGLTWIQVMLQLLVPEWCYRSQYVHQKHVIELQSWTYIDDCHALPTGQDFNGRRRRSIVSDKPAAETKAILAAVEGVAVLF
jgi:hypothetical protein